VIFKTMLRAERRASDNVLHVDFGAESVAVAV
jgi:hypothetical protein